MSHTDLMDVALSNTAASFQLSQPPAKEHAEPDPLAALPRFRPSAQKATSEELRAARQSQPTTTTNPAPLRPSPRDRLSSLESSLAQLIQVQKATSNLLHQLLPPRERPPLGQTPTPPPPETQMIPPRKPGRPPKAPKMVAEQLGGEGVKKETAVRAPSFSKSKSMLEPPVHHPVRMTQTGGSGPYSDAVSPDAPTATSDLPESPLASGSDWTALVLARLQRVSAWKVFRASMRQLKLYSVDRWPTEIQREVQQLLGELVQDRDSVGNVVAGVTLIEPSLASVDRMVRYAAVALGWRAWCSVVHEDRTE